MQQYDDKQLIRLSELLVSAWGGDLTREEFAELEAMLRGSRQAREQYLRLQTTLIGLASPEIFLGLEAGGGNGQDISSEQADARVLSAGGLDRQLWLELAQQEMTAIGIDVPKPAEPEPQTQDMPTAAPARRINRLSLFIAIFSAAALLLMVLLVDIAPVRSGREVVTIVETIGARWGDSPVPMTARTRLRDTDPPFVLKEGFATLQFDNNARVVLEGPTEFQIKADDQLTLHHGRLYATVPEEAFGFTVNAAQTRIIDLGTEFGVMRSAADQDTELHVIKGKVNLISNVQGSRTNLNIGEGAARLIERATGAVRTIPCRYNLFVRQIDADRDFCWRGESVSLADLAVGGSGFGTPAFNVGIDLQTGQLAEGHMEQQRFHRGGFVPVRELAFVDGVFVPRSGPTELTSQGHSYDRFSAGDGQYYMSIGAHRTAGISSQNNRIVELSLPGFGQDAQVLCLHANAGITFDLDRIRAAMPYASIARFTSAYGISQSVGDTVVTSDFYVFVDGAARLAEKGVSSVNPPREVTIELAPTDRFLTLVCTEGENNWGDWSLFVNPTLVLE